MALALCFSFLPAVANAAGEDIKFVDYNGMEREAVVNIEVPAYGEEAAEEQVTAYAESYDYEVLWETQNFGAQPDNEPVFIGGHGNHIIITVSPGAKTAVYEATFYTKKDQQSDERLSAKKLIINVINNNIVDYKLENGNGFTLVKITNDLLDDLGLDESYIGTYAVEQNSAYGKGDFAIPAEYNSIPVRAIGHMAFSTTELGTVTIPESVLFVTPWAFRMGDTGYIDVAEGNPNYKSVDGVLFSKDGKKLMRVLGKENYTIPSGVEIIDQICFANFSKERTIFMPKTVKVIGAGAFHHDKFINLKYEGTKDEFMKIEGAQELLQMAEQDMISLEYGVAGSVEKPEPSIKEGWQKNNKGWWYQNADGSYPENEFKTIGGHKYYFETDGYMVTGWLNLDKTYYLFDDNGHMLTGWQYIDGTYYYMDVKLGDMYVGLHEIGDETYLFAPSGAMVTGWHKLDGKYYSFDESGAMLHDCWDGNYYLLSDGSMNTEPKLVVGDKTYYFDADGEWIPQGWQSNSTGYWYVDGNDCVKSDFKDVDGQTYYFDESGWMLTGWQVINGKDYAFKSSGAMYKNEWCGNYYLGSDGAMLKKTKTPTGSYVDANGKWVPQGWQSNSTGYWYVEGYDCVKSGFKEIKGQTYYFDASGWMATGWKKIDNKWYIFNGSGYMLHDCWCQGTYYLGSDGAMLANTFAPGGYWVGPDGAWVSIVSDAYSSPVYTDSETKLFTVPKINVAGKEVDDVNKELYNMGNEAYYEVYNNAQQGYYSPIHGADYENYLNDGIVSVILRIKYMHPPHKFKVVNVRISDGHVLSNEELGKIKGYSEEELMSKYIQGLNNWYREAQKLYGETLTEDFYVKALSDENLKAINLFINDDGKLTMKVRVFYPAGAGNRCEDIVLE